MSSNELNFDKNNTMIQQERNCIDKRDGSKKFNINYKAMAYDDKCFIDIDTRQSIGPGNYGVTNLYDCECLIPDVIKNSTDNVCVPVPLMAKGNFYVDQDSELKFAENTATKRSNNTLSGVSVPNYFVPMIDHIYANVQNPIHLIEENQGWIRSGAPSRLVVRDSDYATRCNKAYMNKSTNADFWSGKGSLLTQ